MWPFGISVCGTSALHEYHIINITKSTSDHAPILTYNRHNNKSRLTFRQEQDPCSHLFYRPVSDC